MYKRQGINWADLPTNFKSLTISPDATTAILDNGKTQIHTVEFGIGADSGIDNFLKKGALATVTEKIDAKGVITFGDVVSGAVHDYDNANGVRATIQGENVKVLAGMLSDNLLFDKPTEQKHYPQSLRIETIPGMSARYVRWIVTGSGAFAIAAKSTKGGIAHSEGTLP